MAHMTEQQGPDLAAAMLFAITESGDIEPFGVLAVVDGCDVWAKTKGRPEWHQDPQWFDLFTGVSSDFTLVPAENPFTVP